MRKRALHLLLLGLALAFLPAGQAFCEEKPAEANKPAAADKPLKISQEDTLFMDGVMKEMNGDRAGARDAYSKILEIKPDDTRTLISRGRVLAQMGNQEAGTADMNRAFGLIGEALKKNPNDASLYYLRGYANRCLKQFDKAIADTKKAIQLDPNRPNYPLDLRMIELEKRLDAQQREREKKEGP